MNLHTLKSTSHLVTGGWRADATHRLPNGDYGFKCICTPDRAMTQDETTEHMPEGQKPMYYCLGGNETCTVVTGEVPNARCEEHQTT